jgi:hypothetical protein
MAAQGGLGLALQLFRTFNVAHHPRVVTFWGREAQGADRICLAKQPSAR